MTQLSLNSSRMRYLYEIVTKINFFDIPSHFQGKPIEPPTNGAVVRYEMDVRSHGRFHSVRWDDDQSDRGPLADGLRRLFGWTVSFILDAPEVKRLPLSSSPCGKD
jgi:hypothetical protein